MFNFIYSQALWPRQNEQKYYLDKSFFIKVCTRYFPVRAVNSLFTNDNAKF